MVISRAVRTSGRALRRARVREDAVPGKLRDFVELPSQPFEHSLDEPQVLERHARHWRTGGPIPANLVRRLKEAEKFDQGFETVRYCASAIVDMAVHARTDVDDPFDPQLAERLRRFIYGSGNSIDPGAAYRAFRGREATLDAMLRQCGLAEVER